MDTKNSKLIRKPIIVTIIYYLIVISGVMSILGGLILITMTMLLRLSFGGVGIIAGIFSIGIGTAMLIVARALKEMKKWALITLTVITGFQIFSLAYFYFTSIPEILIQEIGGLSGFVFLGIQILVLIYLWSISERFI